jgi:hypothetical protein
MSKGSSVEDKSKPGDEIIVSEELDRIPMRFNDSAALVGYCPGRNCIPVASASVTIIRPTNEKSEYF